MQLSTKKFSRIALLSVALTTGTGITVAMDWKSPAQAAFGFQDTNAGVIEVFNTAGTQIGSGNFSYTGFTGSFVGLVQGPTYESPSAPFGGGNFLNRYTPPSGMSMLTSFAVSMNVGSGSPFQLNRSWTPLTRSGQSFSDTFLFAATSATTISRTDPGSFLTVGPGDPRSPRVTPRDNLWGSCVPGCGTGQQQVFSFNENGTWSIFGPSISSSGTFRLTANSGNTAAIPEPTTVLGTLMAVGTGLWAKRRSKRAS
jgi:hypothetical protein